MPSRILRDFTDSDKFDIDHLSAEAERLFVRLIQKADDFGKFYGDATRVRSYCFPINDPPLTFVQKWLNELEKVKLIQVYVSEGKKCLLIHKFGQRTRIMKSKFPDPSFIDKDLRIKMTAECGHMTAECQQHVSGVRPEAHSESEAHIEAQAHTSAGQASGQRSLLPDEIPMPEPLNETPKNGHARKPDPVWDAVAARFWPLGVSAHESKRCGRVVKILRDDTPAGSDFTTEFSQRCKVYKQRFPDCELTPEALVKHWPQLTPAATGPKINPFTLKPFAKSAGVK